jgi:hypothetical protein
MPIAFHVVVRDRQWFRQWQRRDPSDALFSIAFLAIDVMAAFTQMLSAGMFERYPRLKCAVLEAGSNWIAAWLDRLDHKYRIMKDRTPLEPSAYFFRQCLISADPDESVTAQMVEHLGADYFIWASDTRTSTPRSGRPRAEGAAVAAVRGGAPEGAGPERPALLPADGIASPGRYAFRAGRPGRASSSSAPSRITGAPPTRRCRTPADGRVDAS